MYTRSGNRVEHMEASYGRAARKESKRRRLKRKLVTLAEEEDESTATYYDSNGEEEAKSRTPFTPARRRTTRAQLQIEEALSTPPSASTRAATTPPSPSERLLRGRRKPMCTDYGRTRHFAFRGQGFFFCSPCDLWDDRLPDSNMKASRVSTRFGCTANHSSFSHPTSIRNEHCRSSTVRSNVAAVVLDSALNSCHSGRHADGGKPHLSTASTSSSDTADEYSSGDDNREDGESPGSECDETSCIVSDYLENSATATTTTATTVHTTRVSVSSTTGSCTKNELHKLLREKDLALDRLEGKVVLLQEKLKDMARKNKVLEEAAKKKTFLARSGGQSSTDSRNEVFRNQVRESIDDVVRLYPRWHTKRTGSLIAQAVWSDQSNLPELLKLSRRYFRDKVFSPYNVLREMDMAGGTLSYEGLDILRKVETAGLKRYRGSMIPSKSEIKRMASKVEWFARPRCPFVLKETTKGEAIEFDYAKAMLCITQAFHLDEVGKLRSLSIASSIDGASLTKNLSFIAGGIKITDRGARCPLTKQALLDNPTTMKAQSRNLCIVLKAMMGRETKETFVEFATLFSFLDDLGALETIPPELEGFMPFRCMTNCDLSAQWKGLCKGGAAKVHTLPCTGCATESDCLATPNARWCTRWCSLVEDPEWQCFHKDMATPERVSSIKTEVAELLSVLGSALDEIKAESKMALDDVDIEVPLVSSTTNAASIHFIPQNPAQMRSFSQLLSNELMLRNLDNGGSIETRRESLLESLKGESTIERLTKEIKHGDVREGAYFLLMNTLPCILHMENRNGIKLLTMIVLEGLSNSKKKLLYVDDNAEGTRVARFVSDVENIINRTILGTDDDPCQWMCPFDNKKRELGPITMDNVRTRQIVDSLDLLIDFCVTDPARAVLWTTAVNNYRIAMVLLRKREDFTNDEIATYQSHADKFFQAWIRLWQKEGVTNYLHMIGAGHISDYLYKWRNLYRYSQQGWEAMNSLVKTFFFRRTNHGGGVKGGSKKSRLIPIARWLQRRLMFQCRATEESILQYAEIHPLPKRYRSQMISDSNEDDIYE
jgi:hypothetical protein